MYSLERIGFFSFILVLFGVGVWDVLFNFEPNRCQMTYMFDNPDYVPIKLNHTIRSRFPKYALYVYGEGARVQQYHRKNYLGIPVLFIPGNAGSYRQARSLGSVLLRMAEKRQNGVSFDVFTVDFNEEFAGLYGGFLKEQTKFVVNCLERISALYRQRSVKVVLVGHSVGGIIARALFLDSDFDASSVETILTLSTPHRPVVAADRDFHEFYDGVNRYWAQKIEQELQKVVVISFAGGHRDVLIRSERSDLSSLIPPSSRVLSMTTTSIPEVWASTDHLCIVWCKQLVMATSKALFEMVDFETKQIKSSPDQRVNVLRKYFFNPVSHIEGTAPEVHGKKMLPVRRAGGKALSLRTKKFEEPFQQILPLEQLHGDIFIHSNWWNDRWIRFCKDSSCDTMETLVVRPTRIPWFSENSHFMAILPGVSLQNYSALSFEVPRTDEILTMKAEQTAPYNKLPHVSLQNVSLSLFRSSKPMVITGQNYVRILINLTEIWEAMTVRIAVADSCPQEPGIIRFWVPGFVQDTYQMIDREVTIFPLKLQSATISTDSEVPVLEMLLNPACRYEVTFALAWVDILGQIIRFYVLQIPAFFVAVVVVKSLNMYRSSPDTIWDHVAVNVLALAVLLVIRFVRDIQSITIGFEGSSWITTIELWTAFYAFCYGVTGILEFFIQLAVRCYSWPVHVIISPIVRKLQVIQKKSPTYMQKCLVFPVFALMAGIISYATCGENGILLTVFLYFIKTCYLKRNTVNTKGSSAESEEHSQLILLALVAAFINIVPTLVWTKRLPTNFLESWKSSYISLDPDPSFVISVVLGFVLDLSGAQRNPVLNRASDFLDRLNILLIYVMAALILVFAQQAFYLINLFLSILFTGFSIDCIRKCFLQS